MMVSFILFGYFFSATSHVTEVEVFERKVDINVAHICSNRVSCTNFNLKQVHQVCGQNFTLNTGVKPQKYIKYVSGKSAGCNAAGVCHVDVGTDNVEYYHGVIDCHQHRDNENVATCICKLYIQY
ncbi:hypothetical protein WDU94_010209 [Cyamophila willieti]